MNAIPTLSLPFLESLGVERLGWTLLHFLWQGGLIAALYAAARRCARASVPNTRYLLACGALVAMLAAPLVTWSLLGPPDAAPAAIPSAVRISSAATPMGSGMALWPATVRAAVTGAWPAPFLPWVVAIWLAGSLAFWVRLMGGWVVAARMRSMLVRSAPPVWQRNLGRLGARIGLSRPVRLLVSALVQAPVVVGWLRPVVLVPVGALAGLPAEQMEALLLHELAHIRRHDYLVNILQGVAEALLFYHPAIWWVSGHLRDERELCCDDVAASATGDVLLYARALAGLESHRPVHLQAALVQAAHLQAGVGANGGSLADRIARLLGQSRPAAPLQPGPGAIVSVVLLAVMACGLFGQSDAAPRFEVASVKLNVGDRSGMRVRVLPGGGLMSQNATLQLLMQNAYSLQAFQILGGPGWIQSEGYNIEAKGDGKAAGRAQVFRALQALLEDRFQLKYHHETKELPVYSLTVAKNGPKLPKPKEGSCISVDPNAPPAPPQPGRAGGPVAACGSIGVMGESSGVRMQGGKVPMAELVRILAMVMGRPVVDRTGYTETFDVLLDFSPDESVAGLPRPMRSVDPGGPPPPADPTGPPQIFAAIQEQLGLKLESAKGPVDVLVIDHVERPTGN